MWIKVTTAPAATLGHKVSLRMEARIESVPGFLIKLAMSVMVWLPPVSSGNMQPHLGQRVKLNLALLDPLGANSEKEKLAWVI